MVELNSETKKVMRSHICDFFAREYDLDLGMVGQERVLDFFLSSLGDEIYNLALDDAMRFFKRSQANTEADFYTLYHTN